MKEMTALRATNGISKMLHARAEFTTAEANDRSNRYCII